MHLPRLPTHIGLVQLHHPAKERGLGGHHGPNPMPEVPCGLVADAQPLGQLHGTDPLRTGGNQVHGDQPGPEREFRVVERRARGDGVAVPAVETGELAGASRDPGTTVHDPTTRAHWSVGPACLLEPTPGVGFRRVPANERVQLHTPSYPPTPE